MAPPTKPNTRNNSSSDNLSALSIDQKLDLLLNDVAVIKNDNKQVKEDIVELKEDLKQFKCDITSSLDLCFEKIEDCSMKINLNEGNIRNNEENIGKIMSENISLRSKLKELQTSVSSNEQYSRSNCLEIHGVPEIRNERVLDVVKKVAQILSFDLKEEMVDAVHRLAPNPHNLQAPRGIIVKFCRRLDMELMRGRTRVKNGFSASELGFQSDSKVYVNLSMTRDTRILWAETRRFKIQNNFKFAWMTNVGKIFVRKEEGARAVLISGKEDLDRLK